MKISIVLIFIMFLSTNAIADNTEFEMLYSKLSETNCLVVSNVGFNLREASLAVNMSPACSQNYLMSNHYQYYNNDIGIYFRLLASSNRNKVISDMFKVVVLRDDKGLSIDIIAESCLLGGDLSWYEAAYSEVYYDFHDLEDNLSNICKPKNQ